MLETCPSLQIFFFFFYLVGFKADLKNQNKTDAACVWHVFLGALDNSHRLDKYTSFSTMELNNLDEISPLNSISELELDPRLEQAYRKAEENKSIMPILKEEIRLRILSRRCNAGLGEICLQETKPNIKKQLTPEELMKKQRRRQQNREAAQRCRKKKKMQEGSVFEGFNEALNEQRKLQQEIESLTREKNELLNCLHTHVCASTPSFRQETNLVSVHSSPGSNDPIPMDGSVFKNSPGLMDSELSFSLQGIIDEATRSETDTLNAQYGDSPSYHQHQQLYLGDSLKHPENNTTDSIPFQSENYSVEDEIAILTSMCIMSPLVPISPDFTLGRRSISDHLDNSSDNNIFQFY
ncbi:hypothetical protein CHS0354_014600 [Potamilus streckersoni]|uniref:BZIP domain-containing protein n=1 Tax=Potamilus streckersoni TaxID=2493646 RepID=A0AAE0VH87_9BIVA|nr:hypothetical protein CHS0354_014600 [Potamilus streckersoni]